MESVSELTNKKIVFVGAGSMAEAIVRGLIEQEKVFPGVVTMINRQNETRLSDLRERFGIRTAAMMSIEAAEAISNADIVMLAPKPKDVVRAIKDIRHLLKERQLLISVVAGLSITTIEKLIDRNVPIVRTMPNTSSTIGLGATGISFSPIVTEQDKELAADIFRSIGIVCHVEENQLDLVTGVSGSGPAYVYYLMEAMISAGVEGGLPRETAQMLAVQTVIGAAQMVKTTKEEPADLRRKVTSPGGTTQAAIATLDQYEFSQGLVKAIQCAAKRAKEMGADIDASARLDR
jgi:pyrroline-5-carboxylate reductase